MIMSNCNCFCNKRVEFAVMLQNRGYDSAGICCIDATTTKFSCQKVCSTSTKTAI